MLLRYGFNLHSPADVRLLMKQGAGLKSLDSQKDFFRFSTLGSNQLGDLPLGPGGLLRIAGRTPGAADRRNPFSGKRYRNENC